MRAGARPSFSRTSVSSVAPRRRCPRFDVAERRCGLGREQGEPWCALSSTGTCPYTPRVPGEDAGIRLVDLLASDGLTFRRYGSGVRCCMRGAMRTQLDLTARTSSAYQKADETRESVEIKRMTRTYHACKHANRNEFAPFTSPPPRVRYLPTRSH